jgi:voltage-gated potassium channel
MLMTAPDPLETSLNARLHWSRRLSNAIPLVLAFAVGVSALSFVYPLLHRVLQGEHLEWLAKDTWPEFIDAIGLLELPRVFIGLSLLLMVIGLLVRARLAWAFTLLLLLSTIGITVYSRGSIVSVKLWFDIAVFFALLRYWSVFNRSSLAAGSLFAIASLVSLLWYGILGTLYLGSEFNPVVKDLPTAAYFSVVAMSTVGFGDIVPVSYAARMFTLSIIVMGITAFATSLGAVVTPFVSGTMRKIFRHRARTAMRKDHVILCGATPLATALYKNLTSRGEAVTVVLKQGAAHGYPPETDIILGDASSGEVLLEAGVNNASYVLALREDDPDNAFIVLAVKSFPDSKAKTVAVVNASQNLEKIRRANPDWVFSPQMLGAELLARTMTGEKYDSSIISELFFAKPTTPPTSS